MNVARNIIPAIMIYDSLKYLPAFNREITKARAAGDRDKEREFILKSTDTWGSHMVKALKVDLRVTGKGNLPEKGPVVFAANHQGYADIPMTCAALNKFQFAFVARDDLRRIPLYGKWMSQIRGIFIDRGDARSSLKTIDEGIGLIEDGFSLLVFPEGTRSKGGPVAEFKKGSLRLATKPGVPVIPVTINGTYRIFEESGYVRKGARVDMAIHPPIETKGLDRIAAGNLPAEIERIVKEGIKMMEPGAAI